MVQGMFCEIFAENFIIDKINKDFPVRAEGTHGKSIVPQ